MSSNPIIRIEQLGKSYVIRHARRGKAQSPRLGEAVADWIKRPFSRANRGNRTEELWALRDISLDVGEGEVLGIIGRNGAGKSTLFKILSRITDPTAGRARLRGRVASLLEVGTGFHPDLTGRENIFLNGAILGMTRNEIRRNFDEIVNFSGVEKFLDTPVKRYSSGMYVRLAFSVAAHLESEVLIVDEVLAVGDSAFQEKCLGKMRGIAETSGRTVLFVSHNLATIRDLCQRVCLLQEGRLIGDGPPDEIIGKYLSDAATTKTVDVREWKDRETTGEARILQLELQPDAADPAAPIRMGDTLSVKIDAEILEPIVDPIFAILIHDSGGTVMLDLRSMHDRLRLGKVQGPVTLKAQIESLCLYPGHYFMSCYICDSRFRDVDFVRMCCAFDVSEAADTSLKVTRGWGNYFTASRWAVSQG